MSSRFLFEPGYRINPLLAAETKKADAKKGADPEAGIDTDKAAVAAQFKKAMEKVTDARKEAAMTKAKEARVETELNRAASLFVPKTEPLFEVYDIVGSLGKGAYGEVLLAKRKSDGKQFAIKFLLPNVDRIAITKEVDALIKATKPKCHPNIVCHVEQFSAPFRAGQSLHRFVVMEFINGHPLDMFIKKNPGPPPESEAIDMVLGLLSALMFLQRKGIAHRDIKPENIVLRVVNNEELEPVLVDFGLSCYTPQGCERTAGTEYYLAPEEFDPNTPREPKDRMKSDVYSLGVALREYLRGQMDPILINHVVVEPFAIRHAKFLEDPTADDPLQPEIYSTKTLLGEKLDFLVRKMLTFRPEDRPTAAWLWKKAYDAKLEDAAARREQIQRTKRRKASRDVEKEEEEAEAARRAKKARQDSL